MTQSRSGEVERSVAQFEVDYCCDLPQFHALPVDKVLYAMYRDREMQGSPRALMVPGSNPGRPDYAFHSSPWSPWRLFGC